MVERQRNFELSRRAAAARAPSQQLKSVGRIAGVAFDFVPIQTVIARVAAYDMTGEGRPGQRTRQPPLPVEASGDDLGLGMLAAQPVDEIVPRRDILRVKNR